MFSPKLLGTVVLLAPLLTHMTKRKKLPPSPLQVLLHFPRSFPYFHTSKTVPQEYLHAAICRNSWWTPNSHIWCTVTPCPTWAAAQVGRAEGRPDPASTAQGRGTQKISDQEHLLLLSLLGQKVKVVKSKAPDSKGGMGFIFTPFCLT